MEIVGRAKEDVSLPKATMTKIIKEMLPRDVRVARDAQDLLVECCVEFINLISSESNEICSKEEKRTIAPDHVLKALELLTFQKRVRMECGEEACHEGPPKINNTFLIFQREGANRGSKIEASNICQVTHDINGAPGILGFSSYIYEVHVAYEEHKRDTLDSPKGISRWGKDGMEMTEEEAVAAQQRMFAEARARMNSGVSAPPKEEEAE